MQASPDSVVFESSHRFEFFEYFRVPYSIDGGLLGLEALDGRLGHLHSTHGTQDGRRRLVWWRGAANPEKVSRAGRYRMCGFTIAAHVAKVGPDVLPHSFTGAWVRRECIVDWRGDEVGAVWENDRGDVFLPFDPGEVMHNFWSERYTTLGGRGIGRAARNVMTRTYYLVRPALPRWLQIKLRQIFAAKQSVPEFPRWPLETSLHDMYEWLLGLVASIAGAPVPWIDVWPDGKSWAFVLTHDVETAVGVAGRE